MENCEIQKLSLLWRMVMYKNRAVLSHQMSHDLDSGDLSAALRHTVQHNAVQYTMKSSDHSTRYMTCHTAW